MFEFPNAKRIRRDDINTRTSTSPSPSPSPIPEPAFQDGHERLGKLLNLDDLFSTTITASPANDTKREEDKDNEEEEQEFEFRLFSTTTQKDDKGKENKATTAGCESTKESPAGTKADTQKLRIRVRSPTPGPVDPSEGRLVRPFRGWEYYFSAPELLSLGISADTRGSTEKRRQFEDVAVSGAEMMQWAKQPWPGCHLPWRVIHLKTHDTKRGPGSKSSAVYVVDPATRTNPKSRKKPGKKRRVQLRKRGVAAEEKKLSEAEKRNRKNRERKIKRRQKARDMKAAAAAKGGDIPVEVDEVSSQEGSD